MEKEDVLRVFGHNIKPKYKVTFDLKDEQLEIITALLNNKNAFALLPTGFGKSMCYVLPPLLMDEVSKIYIPFYIYTLCISHSVLHELHFAH